VGHFHRAWGGHAKALRAEKTEDKKDKKDK
jgi:hypothetical protein